MPDNTPLIDIDYTGDVMYALPLDDEEIDDPVEEDIITPEAADNVIDPEELPEDDIEDGFREQLDETADRVIVAPGGADADELVRVVGSGTRSVAHGTIAVDATVESEYELWADAADGSVTAELEAKRSGVSGLVAYLARKYLPVLSPREAPDAIAREVEREAPREIDREIVRDIQEMQAEEYDFDDVEATPGVAVGFVRCEQAADGRITYNAYVELPFVPEQ